MSVASQGCSAQAICAHTVHEAKAPKYFPHRLWVLFGALVLFALMGLRSRYELALAVGKSMCPTLTPGDLLIIDKKSYRHKEPMRGDIILAEYRKGLVIKRIIGLPGEEIELKQGRLYINGIWYQENHSIELGCLNIQRGTLLMGRFATLGDNRSVSQAQVIHPILSKENIVGKVVVSLGL
jgi:signal peptidase I